MQAGLCSSCYSSTCRQCLYAVEIPPPSFSRPAGCRFDKRVPHCAKVEVVLARAARLVAVNGGVIDTQIRDHICTSSAAKLLVISRNAF